MTVELPDNVARRAEEKAAELGIPVSQLVAEVLSENFVEPRPLSGKELAAFAGELKHLSEDLRMIEREAEEAFEQIEPEQWT